MKTDKNNRRQQILLKNTLFVVLAYFSTQIATIVAHMYGFSSISYSEIFLISSVALGSTVLFLLVIKLKTEITTAFSNSIFFGQFILWLAMYTFWVLSLREIRVIALFFALNALMFLLSNARLIQSIIIAVCATTIQIAGSYYAIVYLKQQGTFWIEVFYTFCFVPSALFICSLSEQFAQQRSETATAKHAAEQSRDALADEIKKVHEINVELKNAMNRIEDLASHDELTGLYNRRYLMRSLELEKKRADRTGQFFSIIMLDIDHFKRINDTFGHSKGDDVLKDVANVLNESMRATDICARYGGEEFMVILEQTDQTSAEICAERSRHLIAVKKFAGFEENFSITVSLGFTQYRTNEELSLTISRADEALYRAKNSGRNLAVPG